MMQRRISRELTVTGDKKAQTNIQHAFFPLQQAECISDLLKCCLAGALHTPQRRTNY